MTNQQAVNRISKRRTETSASPPINVISSYSKPSHRRSLKQAKGCLIAIGSALLLLGYALCSMVDLSFLGGVFMVGLDSDSKSNHGATKKSQSHRKTTTRKTTPTLFPRGWKEYSYNDIRSHFHCSSRSMDNAKPLPSVEDWQLMRDTFAEVVDPSAKKQWDNDPVPPTLGYSLEKGIPVPPPYYPKFSHGMGRGLFASRDIKKGELVHDGDVSDVVFPDAIAWRKFVFSLPRDFACDTTDWNWMQKHEEDGPYFMHASIDISMLMNSGGLEFGDVARFNTMPESTTSGRFHALRDIEKGEEVLTDYDAYYTNWSDVGL